MEHLTYEMYLANPAVREQIEREARRARAEAMYAYIAQPVMNLFRGMLQGWQLVTELRRGTTMKLEPARGTEVRVIAGNVWLTQHKDGADHMMGAGESIVLNGKGTTLIYAFADSSLRLAA
jgi:hypothetical protein